MIPALETPSLLLKPLDADDAAATQELFPHWEIVKYLAAKVPWPYPPDGARRFYLDVAQPAMARGEAWHWSLRLKEHPGRLIGCINLQLGEDDNRGFWLALPYHGRGLMTEACEAVTDFWFDRLGFPRLRVPKAAANRSSRRISQKLGMRLVAAGEKDFVAGRLPSEIWEITAPEWRVVRAGR